MMTCDECGSTNRVAVFVGGGKACDDCVGASMPAHVGTLPPWTSNEDHMGGLPYCS